ncbi:hypothetical protein QFW77_02310 [Luteimonas sp. RD2P54]|uniref:PNPLA domain-containing protein n=1 Tax=Luteimonas endophytica TaxID=3042023 RepID=A0ABT6J4U4_9GAMM|nr:hypothetical protein [Luteimonas endophytica]MDH5821829.1 hypothetical protein [Luteimonas endophytica]
MRLANVLPALQARMRRHGRPAPPDLDAVKAAERAVILGERDANEAPELWGLALSGGGIRSATFALGVLQALARLDLLKCFHYQSTVSGGGYIGGFLQALIRRRGYAEAFAVLRARLGEAGDGTGVTPDQALRAVARVQRPILHLREYSNYLGPRKSPFSGDTLGMAGTYVRNVLLVQVQLCALILAMCLLPLLLYGAVDGPAREHPVVLLGLAGGLGMAAVGLLAYVTGYVDRRARAGVDPAEPPPPRIALAALATIGVLGLGSMLGALGLAGYRRLPGPLDRMLDLLQAPPDPAARLGLATAGLYLVAWVSWLGFERWQALRGADRGAPPSPLLRRAPRFLLGTAGAAGFAGVAILVLQRLLAERLAGETLWHVVILGPSLVMTTMVLAAIVHLGLAGPSLSDLQREIWARVGGRTAGLVLLGISLSLGLTIYGPWLMGSLARLGGQRVAGLGWAGVLAWVSTTGIGLLFAHGRRGGGDPASLRTRLLDRVARLAPWVFILGLLVALSLAGQWLLRRLAGAAPAPVGELGTYLLWLQDGLGPHGGLLLLLVAAAVATWLLFGWAVDVNEFSLNAFYRNRLVRCYLGASNEARNPEPTTNFDVDDDLVLADVAQVQRLDGRRPLFPLIGTAMNLVATAQLDWQDRKAASFCLSPGYCGHLPPASRPGAAPIGDVHPGTGRDKHEAGEASLASSLTLGSAMAISGAAVNPNMGYHSSPAVTFLLTLFDARLGWWLRNPSHRQPAAPRSAPFFGGWLLAELLGRTGDGGRFVHLSDGGHFENLGIYELVRRRCRFIVCVDAAADPQRAFADLGNAAHKCRVDFGAQIDIDVAALRPQADGLAERSCAVGRIDYADGSSGTLLYLKPTLTGAESADILHYARTHPRFPHQPTSDQYFDEAQFESYRRLGEDIAQRALEPALERIGAGVGAPGHAELGLHDSGRKRKLLIALRQRWVAPLPGVADCFAVHGKALSRLFDRLGSSQELAVLDAQFHPAWTDLVGAGTDGGDAARPLGRRSRLPAERDFRACFYFCQELIRLMEAVYHDLDFEHAWDHPDNRGWVNAFRHWSWSPMFRIAWTVGLPTFGVRFATFCQQRLDLPMLANDDGYQRVLRVEDATPPDGTGWRSACQRLLDEGRINHVEHGILTSTTLLAEAWPPTALYLLRLRWSSILARTGNRLPDTTVAIAVLSGGTLRLLRVQDHLRRMGLATEFMRLLASRQRIDAVEVSPGYYGAAGVWRSGAARRVNDWLRALLLQTGKRHRERSGGAHDPVHRGD